MTEVLIGDRREAVAPFTGFKVTRATRLVATIAKAYPSIIEDVATFTRDYEAQNSLRITPDMAKMPRFARWKLTQKDFAEKGYLEIPQSPSSREQMFVALPKAIDAAEAEVGQLLALLIAPNSELLEADDAGGDEAVDEYLRKKGRALMHRAEFPQLIALAVAGVEVFGEQFRSQEEAAGKLRGAIVGAPQQTSSSASDASEQDSSSDSDAPTDGQGAKSSTASATAS